MAGGPVPGGQAWSGLNPHCTATASHITAQMPVRTEFMLSKYQDPALYDSEIKLMSNYLVCKENYRL